MMTQFCYERINVMSTLTSGSRLLRFYGRSHLEDPQKIENSEKISRERERATPTDSGGSVPIPPHEDTKHL